MSKLSIDNALNVLGVSLTPANPQAFDAAYQSALTTYQSAQGPASNPVRQLLKTAYLSLQKAGDAAQKACASDPGYAARFDAALSWVTTPLSFEILGAWLWIDGTRGTTLPLESELRARCFTWASKTACWILKPDASIHSDPKPKSWDLDRIRSTYAHRAA